MADVIVFGAQGKENEALPLSFSIERREESARTFACAIRVLLQNRRQGTVGSKSRGEVAFSNKKPWKQKGTGRARVSSLRSPLWRKGGTIFGPQARTREISLNAKQRQLVFNNLFFQMMDKQAVYCFDMGAKRDVPSTKNAALFLKKAELENKKVLLFLSVNDVLGFASFRNISNVRIVFFDEPNAFDLSNCDCWVFCKEDSESFKEMVQRWN